MFPPGAGVALYRQLLFNATARAAWIEQTVAGIDAQVGLYPIVTLQYTAQPLYTRFPIILSSCFSKVTIGYNPKGKSYRVGPKVGPT
jgi:hypothetical protein